MWSRRRMIFVGVAGAVAASATWLLPRVAPSGVALSGALLASGHAALLSAVSEALLGSALPADADARRRELMRVTVATGALIANLPPATQKEIADLLALLAFKPARAVLGYSGDWVGADIAAVARFLAGLRDSSISLKQQAYFALHDLLIGSFYAEPSTWAAIGYPGPPKLA